MKSYLFGLFHFASVLRFIHVQQMSEFPSFWDVDNIPLNVPQAFFILHSFMDTWVASAFWLLMSNTAEHRFCVNVFKALVSKFWSVYLEVSISESHGSSVLMF